MQHDAAPALAHFEAVDVRPDRRRPVAPLQVDVARQLQARPGAVPRRREPAGDVPQRVAEPAVETAPQIVEPGLPGDEAVRHVQAEHDVRIDQVTRDVQPWHHQLAAPAGRRQPQSSRARLQRFLCGGHVEVHARRVHHSVPVRQARGQGRRHHTVPVVERSLQIQPRHHEFAAPAGRRQREPAFPRLQRLVARRHVESDACRVHDGVAEGQPRRQDTGHHRVAAVERRVQVGARHRDLAVTTAAGDRCLTDEPPPRIVRRHVDVQLQRIERGGAVSEAGGRVEGEHQVVVGQARARHDRGQGQAAGVRAAVEIGAQTRMGARAVGRQADMESTLDAGEGRVVPATQHRARDVDRARGVHALAVEPATHIQRKAGQRQHEGVHLHPSAPIGVRAQAAGAQPGRLVQVEVDVHPRRVPRARVACREPAAQRAEVVDAQLRRQQRRDVARPRQDEPPANAACTGHGPAPAGGGVS